MKNNAMLLVQAQIVVAAAMTGIIWFVQCITYPQFLQIAAADFPLFHEQYTSALAPVVAPLMIAELGLSIASLGLLWRSPLRRLATIGALLTCSLWLSTFLLQVPLQDRLSQGWSEPEIRKLINGNWIRTVLWTSRLILLLVLASRLLKSASRVTKSAGEL